MRLIETSTREVVAETLCQSVQGDDKNPPTKEQLLEKDAALLKDYLRTVADGCVEVLAKQVLSFAMDVADRLFVIDRRRITCSSDRASATRGLRRPPRFASSAARP